MGKLLTSTRREIIERFRMGLEIESIARELELPTEQILRELIDDFLHYARQIETLLESNPQILHHLATARLLEILCSQSVSDKHRLTAIQLVLRHLKPTESTTQDGLSVLRQLVSDHA